MGIEVAGLGGVVLLALNVWALVSIIGSRETTGTKVLWCLAVLIFPLLGVLVWLVAGPRSSFARV